MWKRVRLTILCLLALALPCTSQAVNSVDWCYTLTNNGGDMYTYTFDFTNLGPANDAIFKIHIQDTVDQKWLTVASAEPAAWTLNRADSYLDWQTGNGSYPGDGYYRLFGKAGAPSPIMGWTSQQFAWTFDRNGGAMPTASTFSDQDIKIHMQIVDIAWQNLGKTYLADTRHNPTNPVPEPSSFAALALPMVLFGLRALRRPK